MALMKNIHRTSDNSYKINLLGISLMKLSDRNAVQKFEIFYQKGIGIPLIQNIIELNKIEIVNNKNGNFVITKEEFLFFIYYFESHNNIYILIYMDGVSQMNYLHLYPLSERIENAILLKKSISEIKDIIDEEVIIPKMKGVIALFIIGSSGCLYYCKINKNELNLAKHDVNICGFISVAISFSQEFICKNSGGKLEKISFGDQKFYMIIKDNVIFAFLVEVLNPFIQNYMYLIVDEFLVENQENLNKFNGNITPFRKFEEKINQYFII